MRAYFPPMVALIALATPAAAQLLTRPHQNWRTVETRHFVIHYPDSAGAWTLPMAERLESVHAGVSALVGSAPRSRVTVVVDDPYHTANGSALPFLDRPTIFVWPTPPTPQTSIGHYRDWSELLAVHEFAHIAHLTRPTRNPLRRRLWRLLPIRVSPVILKTPRWVIEGYATYVEGKLTGSGRPNGVYRPARLRQWALEGRLPRYGQLNSLSGYEGGAMAYLVGSAFLEWLMERKGEESLVHLWRRMTARRNRSFAEAFAGVYGGTPDDLYGRFTAEVTGEALADEKRLASDDSTSGETVQKLAWATGDPAVSPDGELLALVVRQEKRPPRLVVWKTAEEPENARAVKARARALKLDPEDVPDIPWRPRPKRAVATLYPVAGQSHEHPRFLPDAKSILVSRHVPLPAGGVRADLFVWNFRTGALRRVTHGAGVQRADPEPHGRSAVGERCTFGSCDLVRVDLASGAVSILRSGGPGITHYRPRVARDGKTIVVNVHVQGRWRVAILDREGGNFRYVDPDDGADRYDAAFLPGDTALVLVSDNDGVSNLATLNIVTGQTRPLTRVTSSTQGPDPNPADGRVFFLKLHAKGRDLNRIDPARSNLASSGASQAATAVQLADTFHASPIAPARAYGIGPSQYLLLPGGATAPEGATAHLLIVRTDPVGRFSAMLQGVYGEPGTWSGVSVQAAWRRHRPVLSAELFATRHRPSRRRVGDLLSAALDADYHGGVVGVGMEHSTPATRHTLRSGASIGSLQGLSYTGSERRRLAFAEYGAGMLLTPYSWALRGGLKLHGSTGRTTASRDPWSRAVARASLSLSRAGRAVAASFNYGQVNSSAPDYERFTLGGVEPPLFDAALLSQRYSMPALPLGVASGRKAAEYRISLAGWMLTPYFWSGAAGDDIRAWHRVAGLETELNLDAISLIGFPSMSLRGGAGYSMDGPYRHKTRGYITAVYRP